MLSSAVDTFSISIVTFAFGILFWGPFADRYGRRVAVLGGISIMLAGALGLRALPVSMYPQIAPPAVVINATYPGASAKTVEDSVTQVIEQKKAFFQPSGTINNVCRDEPCRAKPRDDFDY